MTFHFKFQEIKKLVDANIPVLLEGERGTGKTTIAIDIAKELKIPFYGMSMTRQTTLSHLLGFMNVNGIYSKSHLRSAAEDGGLFLLDEIDASDPNVILCLNTIENGYITFPDKLVDIHPNFRLMATANPQDNHKDYNGRSKLDAATLDRFDSIVIDRDPNLEKSLVDFSTYKHIELIRECLQKQNSTTYISIRDSIRYQKRKDLNILEGYVKNLMKKDYLAFEQYLTLKHRIPEVQTIEECKTLEDLWKFTKTEKVT